MKYSGNFMSPLALVLLCSSQLAVAQSDFWQEASRPFEGSVFGLMVNAQGWVFAGTIGDGVCRSVDLGAH
jgi:hypothetical protein